MILMNELYQIRIAINRFVNQYNRLEKEPFKVGDGELLYPSEINMIEAIGKGTDNTVTQLCGIFGVTKGAISQIISKLEHKGYVQKVRNKDYIKEVFINLTQKGQDIFEKHELFHQKMDQSLEQLILSIPHEKLVTFIEILEIAGDHLETYLNLTRKEI